MAGEMEHLDQLENRSVHILREAYANFKNLGMLWSIGKDSTVLLWLARKAFFGHVPIPLVHIDTAYKIPAMIESGSGSIVNIASILSQVGFRNSSAYVAAKHGIVGLSQNAAPTSATQQANR